ncbi:hypothetical protein [Saccharothrix sp. Mg75]|uniref:hypothetical protein n=1 Tax=Saccharothrix sp. Mg75 TaxID=3445357 RepID=UPI003EEDE8DA
MPEHHNRVTGPVFQPVVQARDIRGGVHVTSVGGSFAARSRYREQVRQIAPAELVGRETELAELAQFCQAPDDGASAYRWWRAPKWAGKSALMSWFVLHSPPGVRVVSFFVTGRLAGQDHRGAFVDVVLEQLAELLAEPLPTFLPETTREAHLVGMLAEAAELCRSRGERLVLLVDGLDEDRGSAGPHSIAALLPAHPAAGLRVVVSGRPNPPPPVDLSPHHPLRDPGIVRDLAVSAQARVLRDDMELELDRLLRGDPADRDLLGLVVSAAGGLSGRDLAELTGRGEHEVRRQLRTVAGRSFDVRPSHWRPGTSPEVYLLGHEELQASAEERLGGAAISGYRERLHGWADRYRALGWPSDTPEYLLRGYHRLLIATGDTTRVVACATDAARHDRVLDLSGGDVDALTEIGAAQDVLLAADRPDVTAVARLAVHRDRLIKRGSAIPERLPALWARLGNVARAEALTDPVRDPATAAHLAGALAAGGHPDRAEVLAAAIPRPEHRVEAQLALVRALVAAGHAERAESLAGALLGARARIVALAALARAAAAAGDPGRAVELARIARGVAWSLSEPRRRGAGAVKAPPPGAGRGEATGPAGGPLLPAEPTWFPSAPGLREVALAEAAEAAIAAGDLASAEDLCAAVEDDGLRLPALARLVQAAARAGDHDRAARLTRLVERGTKAMQLSDHAHRSFVVALSATRAPEEVEAHIASIKAPRTRFQILLALAGATREPGALERAVELLPEQDGTAVEQVVEAFADLGQVERAEEVATEHHGRWPRVLVAIGHAAVAAGRTDVARRLAAEAETAARSTSDDGDRVTALRALVLAHAAHGDAGTSRRLAADLEAVARDADRDDLRSAAGLCLVRAAAALGELERAGQLALGAVDEDDRARAIGFVAVAARHRGDHREVERLAGSVADPQERIGVLLPLVRELAGAGSFDRVEEVVAALPGGYWRVEALTAVLEVAPGFAERAARFADSLPHPSWRARLLTAAVRAGRGDTAGLAARAEAVIRQMANPYAKVCALIDLAEAGAATCGPGFARSTLMRARVVLPGVVRPAHHLRARLALVAAGAAVGDHDGATLLLHSFDDPTWRERAELSVVRALATAERFDHALAAASTLTTTRHRVEAHRFLVKALATAGLVDRALDLAEAIPAERPHSRAVVSVISALAASSADLPLARLHDLIEAMADPRHRSDVLEALAGAALRRGDRDLAETTAAAIPVPARQAAVWRSLLEDPAYRATGRPAARLLGLLEWPEALDAVVAAHPETLPAVTAEFDRTVPDPPPG